MHIDDGIDLVMLIIWAVVGIVSVTFCTGIVMSNLKPYALSDKSVVTSVKDNTPNKYEWTVRDYILMMMVADGYCPEPKAVDIKFGNGMQATLVEFNDDFLTHMEGKLQRYYIDYLSTRVDQKIISYDYYYATGEKGRWRFITEN